MRNRHRPREFRFLLLIAAYLSLGIVSASGQAKKTAERSDELGAFAGFTHVQSDYLSPPNNMGVTLGADYTHFIRGLRGLIIPSFEIRGTVTRGIADNQKTIEGGPKLSSTYWRLHPYADFMFGIGAMTFPPPENPIPGIRYRLRDSTLIYVYGGGIAYDVKPNWSAMVDFQQQYWNFEGHPPDRTYPQALTFGFVFHVPFKAYKTR